MVMLVEGINAQRNKRVNDRPVPFFAEIRLEEQLERQGRTGSFTPRTIMRVTIRPKRHRDRRLSDIEDRMRRLVVSIRSYLMANEVEDANPPVAGTQRSAGFMTHVRSIMESCFGRHSR